MEKGFAPRETHHLTIPSLVFQNYKILEGFLPDFIRGCTHQLLLAFHGFQKSAPPLFHVLDGALQFLIISAPSFLQSLSVLSPPLVRLTCLTHCELLASTFIAHTFGKRQDEACIVLWAEQEMLELRDRNVEMFISFQLVLHCLHQRTLPRTPLPWRICTCNRRLI